MDRLELMDLFRLDMTGIEPTTAVHDHDPHPAFKAKPLTFKYEHSNFLFKVWMAGRNSAEQQIPADKGQGEPLSELEVLRAAVQELEAMRDARVDAKLANGEPVAWQIRTKTNRVDSNWTEWAQCSDMERALHSHEVGKFNRFGIMREIRPLYADQPAPVADGASSDKYKAEPYDEVWQMARDMGFANVTDALTRLDDIDGIPRLNPIKQ